MMMDVATVLFPCAWALLTLLAPRAGAVGGVLSFALAAAPRGIDVLSASTLLLTSFIFMLVCLYAGPYLEAEEARGTYPAHAVRFFWPLLFLLHAAMTAICLADNLALMWIATGLTTLIAAPLICLSRSKASLEAAWKYFVLCSVGVSFALLGTVLLYASTRGAGTLSWSAIATLAPRLDPALVRLALLFALVGYGCQMGLAPLHSWLPDAHGEAPTPVAALLSGALLTCAGYAFLRFAAIAHRAIGPATASRGLLLLGLLSVCVAAFFVVIQKDLKRLLAYSSIEHAGIIAIGLGLGGPGVYAALFHALAHAVVKALLFLAAGQLILSYQTRRIARIQGVLATMRTTGLATGAGCLAIVGLPPFAPFLSGFLVLRAAFLSGRTAVGVLLLFALTLTFAGFLAHLVPALCGAARRTNLRFIETRRAVPVMAILVTLSIATGMHMPASLDRTLRACAAVVEGR